MLRKNIAPVVATILCGLLFIIIGSCFSAFLYKKEVVKVENPAIIVAENIKIFDAGGDKEVTKLNLSKMKLGLKPATGEENPETNIPSTVNDQQGSEGQYAKLKVLAPAGAKICVKNVKIEGSEGDEEVLKQKENVFVAIKEIKDSAKSLNAESVVLGNLSGSNEKVELTFYVWLSGKTSQDFKSATISFEIHFE